MVSIWEKLPGGFDSRLETARAIALIDVLRQVDDSIPLDLILVYLSETDVSGIFDGLMNYYVDVPGGKESDPYECVFTFNREKHAVYRIPDAIRSMVKDYMVRCYWDQIDHIFEIRSSWGHVTKLAPSEKPSNVQFSGTRVYPNYVRQALDSFNPGATTLHAAADHIRSLAVSIIGRGICEPGLNQDVMWSRGVADDDVLTGRQVGKLNLLTDIYYQIRRDYCQGIIDKPYREAFFDLVTIMLLLNPPDPVSFREAARKRVLHEYEKLGNESYCGVKRFCGFYSNLGSDKYLRLRDAQAGYIDTALRAYSHLSPSAAICLNRYVRLDDLSTAMDLSTHGVQRGYCRNKIVSIAAAINKNVNQIVRLYMTKELAVAKRMLVGLKRKQQSGDPDERWYKVERAPGYESRENFYPCLLGSYTKVNCL